VKSLRIGCVKYLNARPLIRGWPGEVEFDHPSSLCKRLANGELDVALVSSFEFLRNPIYQIVDDISIASDGPVYSVVVAHSSELSEIREIELDPASQTAVNLLRCLLGELNLRARLTGNIDFQSVRPAGSQPVSPDAAENISTRRTGSPRRVPPAADKMPMFHAFDQQGDIRRTTRNLPHWEQDGASYFVTFRLADAVPTQLAKEWREELETWRKFHPEPWDPDTAAEDRRRFLKLREDWLDQGHGSCVLRNPSAAQIVAEALRFFDSQRYHLDAFVVMPNHVHALVQPLPGFRLSEIVRSWKSYTARKINKALDRSGALWMQESFDPIVRNWDLLVRCRAYIAKNPQKAKLRSDEFILSASEKLRNIDLQSVRPAGLQPADWEAAENISARRTGSPRRVRPAADNMPMFPSARRGRLLIGDQAIRFRHSCGEKFQFWDLGAEWKKLVGLPFVYALWLIRPEFGDAKTIATRLRVLRDRNLTDLGELIAEKTEFTHEFCSRYYREHLRFTFGQKEKEGLEAFANLCALHGLLVASDLAFRVV
jgi:predicted solute-binding protein/REP element-mobilizing transposase RayT